MYPGKNFNERNDMVVRIDEERGTMVPSLTPQQNPLPQVKFKDRFKTWLAKQSLSVQVAVETSCGGAFGAFLATLLNKSSSFFLAHSKASLNPQTIAYFKQAQAQPLSPLVVAGQIGLLRGANAGISCVTRRLRGEEDVQSSMVTGFFSGVAFSLVIPFDGLMNQHAAAVSCGLFYALLRGSLFQLDQQFSRPTIEDGNYSRTRFILNSLGLQKYEQNFKRGFLTDSTLSLLNDRALKEVRIPPGHKLLILDQIQRETMPLHKRRGDI